MEELKHNLTDLIQRYHQADRSQSEADVRANYIDWLFSYLGWDVWEEDISRATRYQREGYIRGAGYVDVGLEIAGEPVLMLEAKRFGALPRSTERTYDRTPEEKQLFRYAHRGKKIPYCILTNFERLHVFNADHEVLILPFDNPTEYLDRLAELQRLSPDKIRAGSLQDWERKREIKPIDEAFLASLQDWRLRLANTIYQHNLSNSALQSNDNFDFGKLMAAVQRILDRLILIRYADDKEVLQQYDILHAIVSYYRNLGAYSRHDHLVREFIELSHKMDEYHNTTLFQRGHLCERVFIPNEVLVSIITEMNNMSFRKFTSDILGNTYETYLGTKLVLKNGEIKSEERRDIRKAGGIFYTPTMVVHYIVDNTLGQLLEELEGQHGLHAIEKAQEISVLDPACGSGSFLIYAYQVLADFYRRMNKAIENEQVKLLASGAGVDMFERMDLFKHLPKPLENYPHHILEKQLYGVDIDPEAAEIAAVNLTMQAFADTKREKLPLILNENIKMGNSLISGTEEELRSHFGDAWQEKKHFNWEQQFDKVTHGFDVVIGNPPYGDLLSKQEKAFIFAKGFTSGGRTNDVFRFFVERGLQLLTENGYLGMILPNSYLAGVKYAGFRDCIMQKAAIVSIIDFGIVRVFEQGVFNSILILKKTTNEGARQNNQVLFLKPSATEGHAIASFKKQTAKQNNLMHRDWVLTERLLARIISLPTFGSLDEFCDSKDAGINYQRIGVGWMNRSESRLSKDILYEGPRQHELDIPYLKGTDIDRYQMRDDLVILVERMLELNKRLAPIRNTPCDEWDKLLEEIERTDDEIDRQIYELYAITEEERQIIKTSLTSERPGQRKGRPKYSN